MLHDTSEHREIRRALEESERRFRTLFEDAPVGILVQREGRLLLVNPCLLRMLGYEDSSALLGQPFLNLVAPACRQEIADLHRRRVLAESVPTSYDTVALTRDGGMLPVHAEVATMQLHDGPALVGYIIDIAERRRTEDALRSSEARYRTLLGSVRDAVHILDAEGRFTFVNDVVVARYGRPREWFIGRSHLELTPVEQRERVKSRFEGLMRGEKVAPYEFAYLSSSGEQVCVEVNATGLCEGGRVVGVLGVSRDIGDRKRTQEQLSGLVLEKTRQLEAQVAEYKTAMEALADSEARYRSLFEHSFEGIAVYQNGDVVAVNRALLDLFGYDSLEEFRQVGSLEHVSPEYREAIDARSRQTAETPFLPQRFGLEIMRKDGLTKFVEVAAVPFTVAGQRYVRATLLDVTARREAQARLHVLLGAQQQAMSVAAHEVRSPLASIKGYTDLLLSSSGSADANGQRQGLERIRANAERLCSIAERFLQFDRLENRARSLDRERFTATELLRELTEEWRAEAEDKGLALVMETHAEFTLTGDRELIRVAISNLISNAIRYSDSGRVTIRARTRGNLAEMGVSDEGRGIPSTEFSKIFERFYRLKPAHAQDCKGIGLGLAIVKRIAEEHGGTVRVESEVGRGSTFSITLPLAL